ncbi:MAG: hypothetical protein ABXS93_07530 [Sulfurimonas sp.]
MRNKLFSLLFLLTLTLDAQNCDSLVVDERLPNLITSDMHLDSSKVYGIDRRVLVDQGATLTIEPGTVLAGCSLYSYLVIGKNAKIVAKGTRRKPITFTSQLDLLGYTDPKYTGEWGGIVIAGNAYTHYKDNKFEADETIAFGSQTHKYDNESSGILNYVVIKHTGFKVKKDKELNALSLAGVGRGTVIKNIAIIGGSDDGIELWGGSVNIDGLYIYNARDDSLDADLGYRGTIKNVLIDQCGVDSKNNHDSSAMEFGNDENLITTTAKDATLPSVKNLTAYVKGGGLYNKYDAGWRLKNIKIISEKSKDWEMLYFRGDDSYTTAAKFLDGDVCFYNTKKSLRLEEFFAKTNSKRSKKSYTPYDYFFKDHKKQGKGRFLVSKRCKGVDEKTIFKGN